MSAKNIEIVAVYAGDKFRSDNGSDFIIGRAHYAGDTWNEFGIKTYDQEPPLNLKPYLEYRFLGHWEEEHPKWGKSFYANSFILNQPHSREGIVRYLQEAPGIGPMTALALWQQFGVEAVKTLREDPAGVAAALGSKLSLEKAELAAEALQELAAVEACMIDMLELMDRRGFPKGTARQAIKAWGAAAPHIVRKCPYKLMRFRGIGFLKTDKMYLDLKLPPERLMRQGCCAAFSVASDRDGHVWLPEHVAVYGLKERIAGADAKPQRAIEYSLRTGMMSERIDAGGQRWLADKRLDAAEGKVARYISQAMTESPRWPSIDHPAFAPLTEHQRERLQLAMAGPVGILGGSPGTGKTFTMACVAKAIVESFGAQHVDISCPTGKAAVRCSEAMAAYKLPLKATTIHSQLGVESAEGGWSFAHNEQNPLRKRFLLLDEKSMVDIGLDASFLAARAKDTNILFIGDVNQLPPVGCGAPLRDLIAAGLPYGELTEIKRNAGTIVKACAAIRDGKQFQVDQTIDPNNADDPKNLCLVGANQADAADKLVGAALRFRNHAVLDKDGNRIDPIWDVQVIVAVNDRSALSRKALNIRLQAELNPGGATVQGNRFRVGDKVIQLKNGFLKLLNKEDKLANAKGEAFVANGQFGRVIEVEAGKTVVSFEIEGRKVPFVIRHKKQDKDPLDDGEGDTDSPTAEDSDGAASQGGSIDLAYAVTCHKLQGSETKVAIIALDEYGGASGSRGVCSRNWLYTAISRAKWLCVMVGKMQTAYSMMRKEGVKNRKTFLVERIQECGLAMLWDEKLPQVAVARGRAVELAA